MAVALVTLGVGSVEQRAYKGFTFPVRTWEVFTDTDESASKFVQDVRRKPCNVTDVHYWDDNAKSGQGDWQQLQLA